jgi:hypothetical protein
MDSDEQRIAKVLGVREVPDVNTVSLRKYRRFILEKLDKNTVLIGREDFPWEEKYVFGPGDPAEYASLKKTYPSYKDEFNLTGISQESADQSDLVAQVQRLSDKKQFQVGLSWLTTQDTESKDFQTLDDFATWVANWC